MQTSVDFGLVLTVLTLVSGGLWAIDAWVFAPRRRLLGGDGTAVSRPWWADYAQSFFPVFLAVLLLRSFLVEPFRIPSGSMMPTLLDGDFILVNKYVYGLRLPVVNWKVLDVGKPRRGDVIVFRYPVDGRTPFIKRVIGLPGDHVVYDDKTLYINNEKIAVEETGVYEGKGRYASHTGASVRVEHLDGVDHSILVFPERPPRNADIIVPADNYFVMGDNRDNSMDSRFWGEVPDANIVGKAFLIWMNLDLDWSRLGNRIK
ncbi:MAG TPA: signal peptidase I [Gammaproteobacteria bacterium]|nr:signal peptidase I [Gammaproteobacteria bacterium]